MIILIIVIFKPQHAPVPNLRKLMSTSFDDVYNWTLGCFSSSGNSYESEMDSVLQMILQMSPNVYIKFVFMLTKLIIVIFKG